MLSSKKSQHDNTTQATAGSSTGCYSRAGKMAQKYYTQTRQRESKM